MSESKSFTIKKTYVKDLSVEVPNGPEAFLSKSPPKIDFKVEKNGIVHVSIGKISFESDKILDNAREVLNHLLKIKPSSSKGVYMKSISMSSTMSPGIKIDTNTI